MHAYLIAVYFFLSRFVCIGELLFGFVICCFQIAYTTLYGAACAAAAATVVVVVIKHI